jgi:hypothetical protein
MNFETEYKNIIFRISIEAIIIADITLLLGDKFNRLPNQTMIELKKGTIKPYNLVIKSKNAEAERTHYWSNVLLTSDAEQLLEELGDYLDGEEILDSIVSNWDLPGDEQGPAWK